MRVFEAIASGVGLALLLPAFAAIAAAIKFTSPGPVLHKAQRVGKDGVPFRLYKFRTMAAGADRAGPGITVAGDPRITPVGSFLRRTKLDELPQLINVLRGEMSLVGPRPEDPRYVALYTPEQRSVLQARPGITSPASLRYRDESALLAGDDWERVYVERIMPDKLRIEMDYLARRTLRSDLAILLETAAAVFAPGQGGNGAAEKQVQTR
jgi:lipopolysaccharide/colanic/teichoic acid biosynthesis glycosyltransferase